MRYYCMFSMMVSAPSSLLLMNLYNWDVEHFLNSRHLHVEFGSLGLQELITLLMIIPAIQTEWVTDFSESLRLRLTNNYTIMGTSINCQLH